MSGKKPERCPFCGCELVYQEHEARPVNGRPLMRYWLHPKTGCFADGFEIMPDEVAAWNERA